MFAVAPDSHGRARAAAADAVATARPDILDRNGEILATDVQHAVAVRRAAPDHRRRRGGRAADRRAARPRRRGVARAARLASAASSGSSARSRRSSSSEIHRLGLPGIGFLPRTSASTRTAPMVAHVIGHVNIDNQGIAGIEKWLDSSGLADLHLAGLRDRPAAEAGRARGRPARAACAARRARRGARQVQGQGGGRPRHRRAHRRNRRDGVGAGLRSEQSARGARSDPHQPAHHRRLRDGLDLQGADARDGARFRQGHARTRRFDARCPLRYGKFTIHDFTPRTAC